MADEKPLGISLQGLMALVEAHGGRGEFAGKSTDWVKFNVVLPSTLSAKTAYVGPLAAAGSPHVAPATAFISHAYDDEFLGVLDSVAALEAKESSSAFYYIDLLVENQHSQGAVEHFDVLSGVFRRSVKAIGRTLLVLRWANPIPLQRAWCVFEIATTLTEIGSIQVLMPPEDAAAFKKALRHDFGSLTYKTCRVDVERAGAREQADLDYIHAAINQVPDGFLKTNQLVIEAMKCWMVEEGRAALASEDGEREKAALMMCLANLLKDIGKLGEAEPLYREALAARRHTLGNEHPNTMASVNSLAELLRVQSKLGEAEPLYREALAVRRCRLGKEHPSTLISINNLAVLLKAQGRFGEAELLYTEALAANRKQGNEHPDTLASINNLAILLKAQGRLNEAEPLYHEALATYRRTRENDHPDTLTSINNLACLLKAQGKLSEAEPLYIEALAAYRRTLGNEHILTLGVINNFANLLSERGDQLSSEALFAGSLSICRRVLVDTTHSITFWFLTGLATCLRRQGRLDEALPLAIEAYDGRFTNLGKNHPDTYYSAHELGVLLRLLDRPEEALPFACAAFEGRRRLQGSESRLTLSSQLSLATLEGKHLLSKFIRESGINE